MPSVKKLLKKLPKPVTFEGSTQEYLDSFSRCVFPCCGEPGIHEHHITYVPSVTKPLCRRHHEDITIINGHKARRVRHALSNNHRWHLWYGFLDGTYKPRRTRKAKVYIEPWDDFKRLSS